MGYWQTNEHGHSFAQGIDGDEPMLWGDAPADVMDEALAQIIAAFRSDLGRAPSLEELKAGLLFSAPTALEDDEKRRQDNELYTYEVVSRWTWTGFDGKVTSALESNFYEATSVEEARIAYEADRDPDFDARVGMERTMVSVEQLEPTPPKAKLTLVKEE